MRNKIAIVLTLISFCCLYPGISFPMLDLKMNGKVSSSVTSLEMDIINKSSSILQTVSELFDHQQFLVSVLIFFFSVCVPVLKGVLLCLCYFIKKAKLQINLLRFIKTIGKWSMADVFVVAIFLTNLSTRSQPSQSSGALNIMGFKLDFDVQIALNSNLGSGFYWFLSYCLISLTALQIYQIDKSEF